MLQCSLSPVKWLHYEHVQGELLSHLIDWTSSLICLTLPGQFRRQLLHLCSSETVFCTIKSCEYLAVRFNSNSLCLQSSPGLRIEHCSWTCNFVYLGSLDCTRKGGVWLCPYMYLLCKLFACNACWGLVLSRVAMLNKHRLR